MTPQLKGVLITTLGVLIIVPDSLLLRFVDAPSLTLVFWRSLTSLIVMSLYLTLSGNWQRLGRAGLLFAVAEGAGSVLFVVAIENTSVASTLFLISTAPVMSALLSWLVLRERLSARMVWTIGFSLIGIAVIASGSAGGNPSRLVGDLAALGVALSLAVAFTTVRYSPKLPVIPALALAYGFASGWALIFAPGFALVGIEWFWITLNGGVFVPLGFAFLSSGPKFITAAEVSLIMLLEAVLAPLLVWSVLGENPGERVLLGGSIVLVTLAVSNAVALLRRKRA